MVNTGRYNRLKIIRSSDYGLYLDGENGGEILLPNRYVPENCKPGDEMEVFVYLDSEDRPVATTEKPYAQAGEVAMLQVKSVDHVGAFLDWGLMKDLLVPFREQKAKMIEGRSYLVYVYVDELSGRIAASAKLNRYIGKTIPEYAPGEEVDLILESETEIGYNAIINNSHWGLLYENEVFEQLERGQRLKGYIKKVREDHKIDLSLYRPGYDKVDPVAQDILKILKQNGGTIAVSDKSDAETIYNLFGVSKKTFKKALGALYKQRLILIEKDSIRLISEKTDN